MMKYSVKQVQGLKPCIQNPNQIRSLLNRNDRATAATVSSVCRSYPIRLSTNSYSSSSSSLPLNSTPTYSTSTSSKINLNTSTSNSHSFRFNVPSRTLSSTCISNLQDRPDGIRAQSIDLRSSPASGISETIPEGAIASASSTKSGFSGAPQRHDMEEVKRRRTELPNAPDRRPLLISFVILAIASWSLFASYANNKERLSTSVFRSVLVQLKDDVEVRKRLGEPVMLVPSIFGEPWVNGAVNMMQGKVDVSFKIQGSKGRTATAYFTSIRRSSHRPFEVLRFLVIPDPGENGVVDTNPISLLGDSDEGLDGNGSANGGSGKVKITTVHDDQGELSLKRL